MKIPNPESEYSFPDHLMLAVWKKENVVCVKGWEGVQDFLASHPL